MLHVAREIAHLDAVAHHRAGCRTAARAAALLRHELRADAVLRLALE